MHAGATASAPMGTLGPGRNAATAESTQDMLAMPSARQIARKLAVAVAAVGAVALLATALPGFEEIPAHLAGADPGWIVAALVLEILSTLAFSVAFHGAFERRSTPRTSASISLAVQGANILLPAGGSGGLAVGAVILDRAGMPRGFAASRTVALFLVTSLVSFAALIVAGLGVATGLLSGEAALVATLLPAVGALVVIVAVALLPRLIRGDGERPTGRVRGTLWSVRNHLSDGVEASGALLKAGDPLVIWGAIGNFAFDVAAIAAAFHAVGVDGLPIGLLVLAYVLGHAGAIIPLPGSSEGGLIGMFVLFGASVSGATAAILAYRAVHAGVPMALGLIGMADVRRLLRRGEPLHRTPRGQTLGEQPALA
jgi:uncharacterized membrane protein YbhN (UPF0104 family)